MSLMRRNGREDAGRAARMTGAVEALFYAALFVLILAFVAMLFGASAIRSHRAAVKERAIELAGEVAETFCAAPDGEVAGIEADGLRAVCSIERSPRPFGFLYEASARVYEGGELVYERGAARYVSARDGGRGDERS